MTDEKHSDAASSSSSGPKHAVADSLHTTTLAEVVPVERSSNPFKRQTPTVVLVWNVVSSWLDSDFRPFLHKRLRQRRAPSARM
ncbi:hypothetical protein PANT_15d00049 [Moesziomyces antarcticus T-34]|uniref:Uncharacterized protein n=1 Tax=Pseudozyma antarctica (strain T-34) TaxID=1151754 RepID=M9LR53_PSEA3|nr:hypothetical protein PANT_15d00049 [Moesziomyces antarcticus T-34]